RYETDMAMARGVGCVGILVLTGVVSSEEAGSHPSGCEPDLVYPSLLALAEEYRGRRIKIV
ncbi:MAG: HAD hydrolase-like protein, partial [Candidatus Bathyarchaeia archaeon]